MIIQFTDKERAYLTEHPEDAMFIPPFPGTGVMVTALIVMPVLAAGAVFAIAALCGLGDAGGFVVALTVVLMLAAAVGAAFGFLRIRDRMFNDRVAREYELKTLAGELVGKAVSVNGFVPEEAEVYCDDEGTEISFCIAAMRNMFRPEKGERLVLLMNSAGAFLVVRRDVWDRIGDER